MKKNLPYSQFAETKLWKVVDKAIADLEKNQDLELRTNRKYVIGYLCEKVSGQKIVFKNKPHLLRAKTKIAAGKIQRLFR